MAPGQLGARLLDLGQRRRIALASAAFAAVASDLFRITAARLGCWVVCWLGAWAVLRAVSGPPWLSAKAAPASNAWSPRSMKGQRVRWVTVCWVCLGSSRRVLASSWEDVDETVRRKARLEASARCRRRA